MFLSQLGRSREMLYGNTVRNEGKNDYLKFKDNKQKNLKQCYNPTERKEGGFEGHV